MTGAAGRLRQLGSGTLILTGSNSYARGTDLVNGTIILGSSNAITTGGTDTLTFTGGILKHTSENTRDYSAKIASIDAGKQARIDTGGQAITYASALKRRRRSRKAW